MSPALAVSRLAMGQESLLGDGDELAEIAPIDVVPREVTALDAASRAGELRRGA